MGRGSDSGSLLKKEKELGEFADWIDVRNEQKRGLKDDSRGFQPEKLEG